MTTDGGAATQLHTIGWLQTLFAAQGIDYWLFGGWAVDFHVGRVTRDHADVDVAVWQADLDRIRVLLEAQGWEHAPEPGEDGYTGYERRHGSAGSSSNGIRDWTDVNSVERGGRAKGSPRRSASSVQVKTTAPRTPPIARPGNRSQRLDHRTGHRDLDHDGQQSRGEGATDPTSGAATVHHRAADNVVDAPPRGDIEHQSGASPMWTCEVHSRRQRGKLVERPTNQEMISNPRDQGCLAGRRRRLPRAQHRAGR